MEEGSIRGHTDAGRAGLKGRAKCLRTNGLVPVKPLPYLGDKAVFANRILLATDGSPEARRAGRMAISLSKALGVELHVAHVGHGTSLFAASDPEVFDRQSQAKLDEYAKNEARATLDTEVSKLRAIGGEIFGSHAAVGRADAKILWIAEDLGAGLVVIGSRGLGPLRRALMGSVSESLVRHHPGSVLVTRGRAGGNYRLPGRILLALDGSGEAEAATRVAVDISNATGSELHVVHTMETQPQSLYSALGTRKVWEEALDHSKREARAWVDRQAERVEAEGGKVKDAHLRFGQPDAEIVKLGDELDAALIVVGSRGLGSMARALVGSVSDSVVRHACGPVLVVRDPDRSHARDLVGAEADEGVSKA